MAISYVFSATTGSTSPGSTNFITSAITGTSNQNDLMIVVIDHQVCTVSAVSDNQGNIYTPALQNWNFTGSQYMSIWYCYQNSHWGSNPTFQCTLSQTGWPCILTVYDYSGITNSPLPDGAVVQYTGGMTNPLNGPSITNNQSIELLFSAIILSSNFTLSAPNWSNPVTNTISGTLPMYTSGLITGTSGTFTPSWTSSQSSGFNYGSATLAFRGTGSTTALPSNRGLMMMGIGS